MSIRTNWVYSLKSQRSCLPFGTNMLAASTRGSGKCSRIRPRALWALLTLISKSKWPRAACASPRREATVDLVRMRSLASRKSSDSIRENLSLKVVSVHHLFSDYLTRKAKKHTRALKVESWRNTRSTVTCIASMSSKQSKKESIKWMMNIK